MWRRSPHDEVASLGLMLTTVELGHSMGCNVAAYRVQRAACDVRDSPAKAIQTPQLRSPSITHRPLTEAQEDKNDTQQDAETSHCERHPSRFARQLGPDELWFVRLVLCNKGGENGGRECCDRTHV